MTDHPDRYDTDLDALLACTDPDHRIRTLAANRGHTPDAEAAQLLVVESRARYLMHTNWPPTFDDDGPDPEIGFCIDELIEALAVLDEIRARLAHPAVA
ncbi:MAG: hypothetical protein ACXIVQ_12095 [Acidimicrobiales bacterium]